MLNPDEIEELFGVLRLLRSENKAIVLIAHKLAEIMAVSDCVTVLRGGRVVAALPPSSTNPPQLASLKNGDVPNTSTRSDSNRSERHITKDPTTADPICKAVAISVYGDRGESAIRGLDLEVHAGEIFGIGGVDGNGQVELGEALAGLRAIDSGELFIRSVRTGYIPQDRRRSGLAVSMSVGDNLLFEAAQDPAFSIGPLLRTRALYSTARSMISDYDIRTPGPNIAASKLSGGNQQKILVARALRSNPGWIVAMNPTRGLDIGAARFVHEQLLKARNRGAAITVISTDLDELAALADRSAILSGGILTPFKQSTTNSADIGLLLGGIAGAHSTEPPRNASA